MDTAHKMLIALSIVLLAVAAWAGISWIEAHDDVVKAQAQVASDQKAMAQISSQIKQMQDADKVRDQAADDRVAAIQKAASQQVTPRQIAKWIPKQLPGPVPITLTIPSPTPGNPTPAAIATIPQADLPALRNEIAECQSCEVKLTAAAADSASKDNQLKLAGENLSNAENERDAWKTAAKGGRWTTRMKRSAKWMAIGGAVVAGAICGTGHCK